MHANMRVYLSSTLIDLKDEREAVKQALGSECIVVESYTADERTVPDSCRADVAGCDLYIGIVGMRYGAIAPGETCSITELEYRQARESKKPTLIFVKDEAHVEETFHDAFSNQIGREMIDSFRQSLMSTSRVAMFKTPADLPVQVLKALNGLRLRQGMPEPPPRPPITGDPYPGLRAFRPNEADRFFGREDEVADLVERLLTRGQRFVALIGASGSGKSSLVYAGLLPKLKEKPGSASWPVITMIPRKLGSDPFLPLANALVDEFPDGAWRADELAERLFDRPADIAAVAEQALANAGGGAQLLLFVDQFEEVFANKVDLAKRSAFFVLLGAAVACPRMRVVISMRADFYGLWPQDEAAMKLLRDGHFPVAVPGQWALAKMIEEPAKAAGLHFEPPQLVQRLLDDTGTAPGALALVEFALAQLYRQRHGSALTATAYEQIGCVAGAIDGLAKQAVELAGQALAKSGAVLDEEVLSRLFVAIASVEEKGEGMAVLRRRAAASELPVAALTLAQHLVDKRLLVSSGGESGGRSQPATFEVGHEAVFKHWQRFRDWERLYAADLAVRQQAERAAAEWHKAGRPDFLRWGWERQKPALEALHKLNHLPPTEADAEYADTGVALWRALNARLPDTPLKEFLQPEPLSLIDKLSAKRTTHQRREEIGLRLNQLPDPRRGVGLRSDGLPDLAWIDVPAGEVTIEIDLESNPDEQPERRRSPTAEPQSRFAVNAFQLTRFPVTWCQYYAFLEAEDGYANPVWWPWMLFNREEAHGEMVWSFRNYPAVNVSWFDAMAFCRWLSAKLGCKIRLPTEREWQWAAVADSGQEYPWRGGWNPARANSREAGIGRTVTVGLYPEGRSPFGLDDMSGNVSEWCLNDNATPDTVFPNSRASRVLRGGSWGNGAGFLRASCRLVNPAGGRYNDVGFRLCRVGRSKSSPLAR